MPKKHTQEIFIEKANTIHNFKYDYSLLYYENSNIIVDIVCPIHGKFQQKPNSHLQGQGCQKCGWIKQTLNTKSNNKEFTEKSNKIHNNFYDYSLINYKNNKIKVKIICPIHGIFEQSPEKHLNKQGCPKCRYIKSGNAKKESNKDFIEKLKIKKIFNNFNYLSEYKNSREKIKIQCKKCNFIFEQVAHSHLRGNGCSKCAGFNKTVEDFIEEGIKIHGNKYDYSLLKKKLVKEKQKIICKKHGIFEQTLDEHLCGKGCKKCANEKISIRNQENPIGWTYTIWGKAGLDSKNFDSFKVYIIECWNESERFYKIGKTFNTIKDRFKNSFPYQYKTIKSITGNSIDISKLENKLQKLNKNNKYLPKIKFEGMYECFSDLDFDEIIQETKDFKV